MNTGTPGRIVPLDEVAVVEGRQHARLMAACLAWPFSSALQFGRQRNVKRLGHVHVRIRYLLLPELARPACWWGEPRNQP